MADRTRPDFEAYSLWDAAPGALRVYISCAAMAEAGRSAQAARGPSAAECARGGLLLGRCSRRGEAAVVRVDGCEAFGCEETPGPSSLLSPWDRAGLDERLTTLRVSGVEVVGLFRNHAGEDDERAHVRAEDWRLLDSTVAGPAVFLLVRPTGEGSTEGRMHARMPGRAVQDTGWLNLPFPSKVGASGGAAAASLATAELPASEARPPDGARSGRRLTALTAFSRRAVWPALAGIAGAAFGLATVYGAERVRAREIPAAPLRAIFSHDLVTVEWDRRLKGFEGGATLTVVEGAQARRFEVPGAEAIEAASISFIARGPEARIALDAGDIHEFLVAVRVPTGEK